MSLDAFRSEDHAPVDDAAAMEAWERAARPVLVQVARRYGSLIAPADLAEEVQALSGVRTREAPELWIDAVLDAVGVECGARTEPLLSAFCVAADGRVYYDFADSWVPLVEQRRPRYEQAATLYTPRRAAPPAFAEMGGGDPPRPAFDGKEPGCVWHRLLIDGCIPPETEVRVWSRAGDDEQDLDRVDWQPERALYRRGGGSELPYAPQAPGRDSGTWELLFQRARGRYLQLRLELRHQVQRALELPLAVEPDAGEVLGEDVAEQALHQRQLAVQ